MKRFAHTFGFFTGIALGIGLAALAFRLLTVFDVINVYESWNIILVLGAYALVCIVTTMICVSLSEPVGRMLRRMGNRLENLFADIPTVDLVWGVLGLIVGLVLALLVSQLYNNLPWGWLQWGLTVVTYIVFAYLGITIATKRKSEITSTIFVPKRSEKIEKLEKKEKYANPKILDTSVIIDGRVLDVCRAGFLEGTLIISDLVLHELRHIADDSEQTKRTRGRRGLDILKMMQDEFKQNVVIVDTTGKYKDVVDVDEKLVYLTRDLKGKIVTNDYNLNKMAAVHKIQVLNINELAQSIKLNIMTGEVMTVEIIKKGKSPGQGAAYLDDGTMIVVENGEERIGSTAEVEVTSIIQTASGRMIFAAIK